MKRRELLKALLASFAVASLPVLLERKEPWKVVFHEYVGWVYVYPEQLKVYNVVPTVDFSCPVDAFLEADRARKT